MPICRKCHNRFPNRVIIEGKPRNLQSREFCLDCSPFNLHNTRKIDKLSPIAIGKKTCPRCNTEKDVEDFYLRRDGSDLSSYCKKCSSDEVKERQRKFKKICIDYKGGKCSACGYSRCDYSLIFHHTDPTKKDFTISHCKLTTFNDRIRRELDKCILLCANCHGEEHARLDAQVAELDTATDF